MFCNVPPAENDGYMIGCISALPLTGIVPISNVLAPRFTVGMEDCGVIVVIWAPGPVVELTLLLGQGSYYPHYFH